MSDQEMADISDEDWAEHLRRALEQSQAAMQEYMELGSQALAKQERMEAMEAELEGIEDPAERERQRRDLLQVQLNDAFGRTDNAQGMLIGQLQQAVLLLADRVRQLQIEVRELRAD